MTAGKKNISIVQKVKQCVYCQIFKKGLQQAASQSESTGALTQTTTCVLKGWSVETQPRKIRCPFTSISWCQQPAAQSKKVLRMNLRTARAIQRPMYPCHIYYLLSVEKDFDYVSMGRQACRLKPVLTDRDRRWTAEVHHTRRTEHWAVRAHRLHQHASLVWVDCKQSWTTTHYSRLTCHRLFLFYSLPGVACLIPSINCSLFLQQSTRQKRCERP